MPGVSGCGLAAARLAASLGVLGVRALMANHGTEHHTESRAAKRWDRLLASPSPGFWCRSQNGGSVGLGPTLATLSAGAMQRGL